MNFGGYVPLNRGLIEHTMDGRLTNNEALVFVWLLMLADRKTGSYTINQPTLRTFLPGLSKWAAQDALEGLGRKRYIYRDVKPRSAVAYRYWIAGFIPTDGPHKSLQLDLSEVFATKDTSKLRYVKHHPETPPATQLGTPPATPNSNKKGEKRRETQKETSSISVVSIEDASSSPHWSTGLASDAPSGGGCAPMVRDVCADGAENVPSPPPDNGTGLRYTEASGFIDTITGERVSPEELNLRIAHLGMQYTRGRFCNARTGSSMLTREAVQRITAAQQEKRRAA